MSYSLEQSRYTRNLPQGQFYTKISRCRVEKEIVRKTYDLVKPAPDKYNCMICSGLLERPVLMSCCGQHFCESCLKKWYAEQGNKCPHCRNTGVTYLLNKERVRDINELLVYCSNKSKGCIWEDELGSLDGHVESNCGFVEIDCPKGCKIKLLRDKMSDHIRDSCLCRDYSCEHCQKKGTYHTITGECGEFGPCWKHGKGHYSTCQQYPVQCPNECSKTIKRGEVSIHRESCPLEHVECSFSEVGCQEQLVRRDLDNHMATSDHQHLLLMMKAFKELKQETKQLRDEVKSQRRKIPDSDYPEYSKQVDSSCLLSGDIIRCCFYKQSSTNKVPI